MLCLASATRAEERAAPIRDDAGLFHADAAARAELLIDTLRRNYDRNLFVDTLKSTPPHERKLFRFLWTRQVNRILEEQAQKRARESGVDGIYVVICNDPKDVHVVVQPADDAAFTRHDAEALRRTVARRLQDSGPDAALLALVEQVRVMLHAHAMRGQSTSVVNELVLAGLLGGGVGFWLILCGIRYKMRLRDALLVSEVSTAEQTRRMPALLGAMFGSLAGQWIYDKLYPSPSITLPVVREPDKPSILVQGDDAGQLDMDGPVVDERPEDAPVSP